MPIDPYLYSASIAYQLLGDREVSEDSQSWTTSAKWSKFNVLHVSVMSTRRDHKIISRGNKNGSKWCYGPCYNISVMEFNILVMSISKKVLPIIRRRWTMADSTW
jgi:ABC-type uncharacterized transport system substrate-binding protein